MNSTHKISRRKFIFISLLTLIAVIVATISFFSFDTVVKKMLSKDLSHLKISEESFDKFVADANKEKHWQKKFFDWTKKQLVRFSFMIDSILPSFPYKYKYVQYRSEIVGDFLLSTDFFMNKMDTKRTVNYIGLYNPYLRPCSNPFSNLYYTQG